MSSTDVVKQSISDMLCLDEGYKGVRVIMNLFQGSWLVRGDIIYK